MTSKKVNTIHITKEERDIVSALRDPAKRRKLLEVKEKGAK
ncbi:hypothetical protein [Flavonifractor sp. An4]|nr:hypothetical protein [Flavonifractor sp. An4]